MSRLLFPSLVLIVAVAALLSGVSDDPSRGAASPRTLKPLAPIEVSLTAPDGEPPGDARGAIPVRFAIAPRRDLVELSWRWELPPELALVEGPSAGAGEPAAGARSEGLVTLVVPDDGRYHRAELVVDGLFETVDEAGRPALEPITRVATLTWGEPTADLPLVLTADPGTGQLEPRAVVPSSHRAAVQPAGEGR